MSTGGAGGDGKPVGNYPVKSVKTGIGKSDKSGRFMKIQTGGMELIDSEAFIAVGLGETILEIGDGSDMLRLILNFVESEGEKKTTVEFNPVDGRTLNVILTNWNYSLGTTLIRPIEVGIYRKRKLFILFSINKSGEVGQIREVLISLYLGEEVQDDQN